MPLDTLQPVTPQTFPPTESELTRIRLLTKKTRKSHCLRLQLSSLHPLPLQLDNDEFYSLLFDLRKTRDKDWRIRALAAWALGLSKRSVSNRLNVIEHLCDVLGNRLTKKSKLLSERIGRTLLRTFAFCYPFITLLVCLSIASFNKGYGFDVNWITIIPNGLLSGVPVSLIPTVFLLPIILPLGVVEAVYSNNEARMMAAQALLRQNALEALPELMEYACDKSLEVSNSCQTALIHLLPLITEQNRNLMPINSEELISKILEARPYLALGSVVLDYLEKFGTGQNCTAVEFYLKRVLAPKHKAEFKAEFAEVYAKAQLVLAILQERHGRNQESELLLRHSTAPNAQPVELLRPAADSQTTPAEQLLRASNSE